ncbi:hypothetical protein PIB30_050212 [Stylosanthes scabra]|uniref:DUF4283 domain-containing protein n=1 Tax=Stylosanthes scabra TaxID=79078 RepID=A0ABU6VJI6_9FABA|nr:hypothetical protein [Stylosanthes scabra]
MSVMPTEGTRGRVFGGLHPMIRANFTNKSFKVSFRDKVVGAPEPKPFLLDDSLDGDRLAVVQQRQVLGKHVSYTSLVHRLKHIWKLHGGYEILDVGFGYFLVKP